LKFPEGWEISEKNTSVGEVWIFSGTTYTHSEIWGITGDLVDKKEFTSLINIAVFSTALP